VADFSELVKMPGRPHRTLKALYTVESLHLRLKDNLKGVPDDNARLVA